MSVTLIVPDDWPYLIPARSGLPPRTIIPGVLDAQQVWLVARRRYSMFVPLCGGRDYQLTKTQAEDPDTAGSGAICQVRIRVPPWTEYIRWWVLSERDANLAECYVHESVEAHPHMIRCTGAGGDSLPSAVFYPSDGAADADDEPQHIDDTPGAAWGLHTIEVWLDNSAEIYGVCFEAIWAYTITG